MMNLGEWKKVMPITLSLGSYLLIFDVAAQVRRRIPVPSPNRPKLERVNLEGKVLEEKKKLYQKKLTFAVNYLLKNPMEIESHLDPKLFKVIAHYVRKGEFEKLEQFDTPKLVYDRTQTPKLFNGPVTALEELADSLIDSEDEQNIKDVYAKAYSILPVHQRRAFKSPKIVSNLTKKEAKLNLSLIFEIIGKITFIPIEPTSPGWKWDCDDEIGQQKVGSGDGAGRCKKADFHPDSLFTSTNQTDFPLKYYHTCIKSQASRGTCVGFAITAAVESALMVKEDKAYNFSEQFTYFYGEIYSNHGGRYSYGLNTGNALKELDKENIKFQYESYWEYNPSNSMDDKSGNIYPDSCVGYNGEMCTNFAFQSQESITGIWPFKNYNYTVPYRGTNKNVQVKDTDNIWFSWNKSASLDLAIALTKAKVPLVLSFNVKQNFMDTGSDGYVYYKSGQDQVGGHASVILGFVANNKLPAGVAPAKEKGFFIVKNSWGTWNGDCGYYYIDYKYLKKYAKGIFTVQI